ncbi:MAG: hypothetical protein KME35_08095 [Aphanocapsa sp. GSE-SYN-MK-11-07L]|nr:hypothetical protein [Aphanocapsa sp. GSE-SYN-MK-11-07L]
MCALYGPKRRPQEFGFGPPDTHLVANDATETIKGYAFGGQLLFEIPALCKGTGGDDWRFNSADTPPGLYKLGAIYNDIVKVGMNPEFDRTLRSFGWISYDMIELESQEIKHGRAGIMLHGGGSGCGWPGAWQPRQRLYATFGCVRCHNIDLRDKILPRYKQGTVYLSVYQD